MADEDIISIPEVEQKHNDLIALISKEGFLVPEPNERTRFRVGHIEVRSPKPNHPTSYRSTFKNMSSHDGLLPVGYAGHGSFFLVNTDEPALAEYHTTLRKIVEDWVAKVGEK